MSVAEGGRIAKLGGGGNRDEHGRARTFKDTNTDTKACSSVFVLAGPCSSVFPPTYARAAGPPAMPMARRSHLPWTPFIIFFIWTYCFRSLLIS